MCVHAHQKTLNSVYLARCIVTQTCKIRKCYLVGGFKETSSASLLGAYCGQVGVVIEKWNGHAQILHQQVLSTYTIVSLDCLNIKYIVFS